MPAAAPAGDRCGAGSGAAPLARAAGGRGLERNLQLHAVSGVDELDRHLGENVGSARPAASAATPGTEQVVPEERAEEVAEVAEIEVARLETAGAEPRMAVAVVELARLGIRERLVGLRHLAEAELGVRLAGDVRMELPRELAESLLDRLLVGGPRDAEQIVVVAFGGGHGPHIVPAAVALAPSRVPFSYSSA